MPEPFDRFIDEDLGRRGDATTAAVLGTLGRRRVAAAMVARQRLVVAGLLEAAHVFERFNVRATLLVAEGEWVAKGGHVARVEGPAAGVLGAERLALNFVGRMSGIATTTRRLQSRVERVNPSCRVCATRKTTPGFRAFEKRAVVLGGGDPHRYGLYDAVLVKDNHLALGVTVAQAVARARKKFPELPVQVEVENVDQGVEAARARAHWILIDNQTPTMARRIAKAARAANSRVRVECSGGLRASTVEKYAAFSDRLSLGLLTQGAASADVGLDVYENA